MNSMVAHVPSMGDADCKRFEQLLDMSENELTARGDEWLTGENQKEMAQMTQLRNRKVKKMKRTAKLRKVEDMRKMTKGGPGYSRLLVNHVYPHPDAVLIQVLVSKSFFVQL